MDSSLQPTSPASDAMSSMSNIDGKLLSFDWPNNAEFFIHFVYPNPESICIKIGL